MACKQILAVASVKEEESVHGLMTPRSLLFDQLFNRSFEEVQ
jgi:hypothetical protein